MGAKNQVIAGDYSGCGVGCAVGKPFITLPGFKLKSLDLDRGSVLSYELIGEEQRKSAASGIIRGAVGAALLGPVGMMAGVSAKNKGIYTVAIKFRDGKNSLLEVDEKIYKTIVKVFF